MTINQRQCVFLRGDRDWCQSTAQVLLTDFDKKRLICISNDADISFQTILQKQAQKYLGKEFDAVIFNALDTFNPDSFGAIVGTIKAGGTLIVFLPNDLPNSLWLQRFYQVAIAYSNSYRPIYLVKQGDELPTLSIPKPRLDSIGYSPTDDQKIALTSILNVVHGHRRRPLVLSSDRGRGKSAVLGMAAAKLIKEGKKTIIVTAPSLATADTVFEHAAYLLPDAKLSKGHLSFNKAEIKFIAPDALIESEQKADLLLVDEAAAIPAPMLAKLLNQFSRIVFASTMHGYEGTGLGFAIRFKQILDQNTPSWRSLKMTTPIRWTDNDQLEAFSFQALLLDAEPVNDKLVLDCRPADCNFELIDRSELIKDETSLVALFGLMVLAHYRTRPSDLQLMLDRDDVSVYVLRYQGHIVASAWLVEEGTLEDGLSQAIYDGTRRLKGHLLPQSLLAHVGITAAGSLKYQRVIRIAVHPVIQQRGLGHYLLSNIVKHIKKTDCDIIGTSFSVSDYLLDFWSKSDFIPVRLGVQQDTVSDGRAMMMLMPLSTNGLALVNQGFKRFSEQWPFLLQQYLQPLQPELVVTISQLLATANSDVSEEQLQELTAFAFQQRGFEVCQFSLWRFVSLRIIQPEFLRLPEQQQALCVMLLLQQRAMTEIAKQLNFTGKAQLIKALRQAIAVLLH